jgi:DNA polymerase III alpha subunit (gram-positive type)
MPRATWFCIDIECSGPVPALYDMISLGAVVVNDADGAYQIGDTHYVEIRPTAPRVDAGAMKVNGLDIDKLRRDGRPMEDALRELTAWVKTRTVPGSQPVFVGHNAPFDWSFVAYAYRAADLPNPFGYKALDTKALAMGVLGIHWFDTNKEVLEQRLHLPVPEREKIHRADYDAWYQAHILIGLLNAQKERA